MTNPATEEPNNEAKESKEEKSLTQFLRTEAILLGLATGALYLFSYFFQKSYLSHFGVPATFVELSLTRSVVTVSFIVIALVTVWNLLVFFPIKPLVYFFKLLYAFFGYFLLFVMAVPTFWIGGFNWLSVLLLLFLLIATLFFLYSLVVALRAGKSLEEWLAKQMEAEDKARDKFAGQRFVDGLGREVALVVLFLTIVPFSGGALLGKWSAKGISDFAFIEVEGTQFVLVSEYRDGFVFASLDAKTSTEATYILAGEVLWMSLGELNRSLMKVERARVSVPAVGAPQKWTTWSEFWKGAWGNPVTIDRP